MSMIADGIGSAQNSMQEWRARYDREVYPGKLVFNQFYRAYPYAWCWENRRLFFGDRMSGLSQPRSTPETAVRDTVGMLRDVQLNEIRPFMGQWMAEKRDVGIISHQMLDPLVRDAASGNNQAVEELEYTFCCNAAVFACLNIFFAAGSAGLTPVDAFGDATGAIVSDQYLTSNLRDLMTATQQVVLTQVNSIYRPLGNLF
jgi:hypothetical protein